MKRRLTLFWGKGAGNGYLDREKREIVAYRLCCRNSDTCRHAWGAKYTPIQSTLRGRPHFRMLSPHTPSRRCGVKITYVDSGGESASGGASQGDDCSCEHRDL